MSGTAEVYTTATLSPSKLELLATWLPEQPWFDGDAANLTRVAHYRLVATRTARWGWTACWSPGHHGVPRAGELARRTSRRGHPHRDRRAQRAGDAVLLRRHDRSGLCRRVAARDPRGRHGRRRGVRRDGRTDPYRLCMWQAPGCPPRWTRWARSVWRASSTPSTRTRALRGVCSPPRGISKAPRVRMSWPFCADLGTRAQVSTTRSARARVPSAANIASSWAAQHCQYGRNASPSRPSPRARRISMGASTHTRTDANDDASPTLAPQPSSTNVGGGTKDRTAPPAFVRPIPRPIARRLPHSERTQHRVHQVGHPSGEPVPARVEVVHMHHGCPQPCGHQTRQRRLPCPRQPVDRHDTRGAAPRRRVTPQRDDALSHIVA